MTDVKKTSTRRAFFLKGGAVLGAGVAATAGAAGLASPAAAGAAAGASAGAGARGTAEDREAIRRLHLESVAQLENQSAADRSGADASAHLFGEPGQVQLGAYRQTSSQQNDEVTFSEDGLRATATFHCEVELCTPLPEDCTAAQMARMQGLMASRRWERGRFEGRYVKTRGQWQTASISYIPS